MKSYYFFNRFIASSFVFSSIGCRSLLLTLLLCIGTNICFAAPGDLDTAFGSGGKVMTPFGASADNGIALAIQPDGKIIVVGSTFNGANNDFALARYNIDGSLDASFGTEGRVTTPIGTGGASAGAVALQSDGKIVVVGGSTVMNNDFALVRYNPDGSLDMSFGTGGKVITPMGTGNDSATAVVIQSDGKIVAVGSSDSGNSDFALARYNSDGSLDSSFGIGGKVLTDFGGSTFDGANDAAIQPDGKIIAVGSTIPTGTGHDFALARYNLDGSLDTTFGMNGKLVAQFSTDHDIARAVAIQSDYRIVVAGYNFNTGPSNYTFALMRFNSDGSIDSSFGTAGKVATDFSNDDDLAFAVTIQPNGKLVAAGIGHNGTNFDFALARYNTDGSLDSSFGTGGKLLTAFATGNDEARGVAVQSDGKIVAAGRASNGSNNDFAVARYLGDPVAPPRTAFDFDGDGKTDYGVFRPSSGVWYFLNSQTGFSAAQWGIQNDKLTPADFDGDGKTDIAVYRNGTWYLLRSTEGFAAVQFGLATDIPVPADYNGDGRAEIAIFRPSDGSWWTFNLTNSQVTTTQFGISEDKPVPADYDGDGKADIAVFRQSTGVWYLLRSSQGFAALQWGISTDRPVAADFDGDGKADQAVYRDGTWYLFRSAQGVAILQFGLAADKPVVGDYDGDAKTDIAVWRATDGVFYLLRSGSGNQFSAFQFGLNGDSPLANSFVP